MGTKKFIIIHYMILLGNKWIRWSVFKSVVHDSRGKQQLCDIQLFLSLNLFYYYTSTSLANISFNNLTMLRADKDMNQCLFLVAAGVSVHWNNHFEKKIDLI